MKVVVTGSTIFVRGGREVSKLSVGKDMVGTTGVGVGSGVGVGVSPGVGVGPGVGVTPMMVISPLFCGGATDCMFRSIKTKLFGAGLQVSGAVSPGVLLTLTRVSS